MRARWASAAPMFDRWPTPGFRGSIDDYTEMRAVQVTPRDVSAAVRSGGRVSSDDVIDLKTGNAEPPEPPEPPDTP